MPVTQQASIANNLLAALPRKDYQQLLTGFQQVELFYVLTPASN